MLDTLWIEGEQMRDIAKRRYMEMAVPPA